VARTANPDLADRRRRQIMDAAIACFRSRGFHQATMQEICAEASISAGALYRYFGSKAEIIQAIAEEKRGESDAALMRTAEREGVVRAICVAGRAFFQKFADGDGALITEIMAATMRDPEFAESLRATDARSLATLVKAIKAAQARDEIDATLEPESTAHTLCAAIEGIGLRRAFLGETDADAAEAQLRLFAERYLKASPPRATL